MCSCLHITKAWTAVSIAESNVVYVNCSTYTCSVCKLYFVLVLVMCNVLHTRVFTWIVVHLRAVHVNCCTYRYCLCFFHKKKSYSFRRGFSWKKFHIFFFFKLTTYSTKSSSGRGMINEFFFFGERRLPYSKNCWKKKRSNNFVSFSSFQNK